MGTWGNKTFDDDDARDWLYKLADASDPVAFLKKSLLEQEDSDYLDSIAGRHILCAAEIIHGVLYGSRQDLPENAVSWINDHKDINVSELNEICIKRISHVLSDKSELNELWAENEEVYHLWLNNTRLFQESFR